jgi:hypothetical protein
MRRLEADTRQPCSFSSRIACFILRAQQACAYRFRASSTGHAVHGEVDGGDVRGSAISVPKELKQLYDDFPVLKGGRYGCPRNFNRAGHGITVPEKLYGENKARKQN